LNKPFAAKPDDETVKALSRAAGQKQSGAYIWRTVGDDKVRGAHAALNGTLRDFSDSPDPGEDFNCRCWAEPVKIGPPDCRAQKEAYDEAKEKLAEIDERHKKAENELRELINQRDALLSLAWYEYKNPRTAKNE
jgi:uncharacterized protein with gpF-like domain